LTSTFGNDSCNSRYSCLEMRKAIGSCSCLAEKSWPKRQWGR